MLREDTLVQCKLAQHGMCVILSIWVVIIQSSVLFKHLWIKLIFLMSVVRTLVSGPLWKVVNISGGKKKEEKNNNKPHSLSFLWKILFSTYTYDDTHALHHCIVSVTCFAFKADRFKGPISFYVAEILAGSESWQLWWSEQITIAPMKVSCCQRWSSHGLPNGGSTTSCYRPEHAGRLSQCSKCCLLWFPVGKCYCPVLLSVLP